MQLLRPLFFLSLLLVVTCHVQDDLATQLAVVDWLQSYQHVGDSCVIYLDFRVKRYQNRQLSLRYQMSWKVPQQLKIPLT